MTREQRRVRKKNYKSWKKPPANESKERAETGWQREEKWKKGMSSFCWRKTTFLSFFSSDKIFRAITAPHLSFTSFLCWQGSDMATEYMEDGDEDTVGEAERANRHSNRQRKKKEGKEKWEASLFFDRKLLIFLPRGSHSPQAFLPHPVSSASSVKFAPKHFCTFLDDDVGD